MNIWKTEKIVPNRLYRFSQIQEEIGIHRSTLTDWRQRGRLVCSSKLPSATTGLRLLEAINNRLGL